MFTKSMKILRKFHKKGIFVWGFVKTYKKFTKISINLEICVKSQAKSYFF